jgi:hypothetical protein
MLGRYGGRRQFPDVMFRPKSTSAQVALHKSIASHRIQGRIKCNTVATRQSFRGTIPVLWCLFRNLCLNLNLYFSIGVADSRLRLHSELNVLGPWLGAVM